MIAYKVLRRTRDGRLTSFFVRGEGMVTYSEDGYVRGCPGTGLFCFEQMDSAQIWQGSRFFISSPVHSEVWRVRVRGRRRWMWLRGLKSRCRFTCKFLTQGWRDKVDWDTPGPGWLIAREVRLLEKVA